MCVVLTSVALPSDDADPWTRCKAPTTRFHACNTSFDCEAGTACRASGELVPPVGFNGARCLTYADCINFGAEDNTTSFNGCAPITGADAADNDKTSGWCKEGDFWQAANYTVRNTVTVPWDGASLDVSISAEIIEKLNVIFANASGYNQTTCLCRDNRMLGVSPFRASTSARPFSLQHSSVASVHPVSRPHFDAHTRACVQDGLRTW